MSTHLLGRQANSAKEKNWSYEQYEEFLDYSTITFYPRTMVGPTRNNESGYGRIWDLICVRDDNSRTSRSEDTEPFDYRLNTISIIQYILE